MWTLGLVGLAVVVVFIAFVAVMQLRVSNLGEIRRAQARKPPTR